MRFLAEGRAHHSRFGGARQIVPVMRCAAA